MESACRSPSSPPARSCWGWRAGLLSTSGPLRPPRGEHARRDEADAAGGAVRILLQAAFDLLIFALHLLGHRGARFAERGLEFGHRHRPGVDRPAQGGEAGAADEVLEIGAGEALAAPRDGI